MKKKIATVWFGGCSGCHMSVLDIDERILEVVKLADIVKSPIVDTKEFPECDVALIEGAIVNDEHVEEAKHIRSKTKILIALGDCAVTGNVPVYRNQFTKEDVLKKAYADAPSNDSALIPDSEDIAKLIPRVLPLGAIVAVDYFIPGCPPSADNIFYVLSELLHDRVPRLDKEGLKYG